MRCLGVLERAYPRALRARLLAAAAPAGADAAAVAGLHVELAEWWSGTVERFGRAHGGLGRFGLLASHGHTLHHRPPAARARGWSLQVGDPATLAERTGLDLDEASEPLDGPPAALRADGPTGGPKGGPKGGPTRGKRTRR